MFDFIKNIGPTEIIVLVIILVIFFGSKIAVGIGRAGGQTLKEIKRIKNEFTGAVEEVKGEPENDSQKGVSK